MGCSTSKETGIRSSTPSPPQGFDITALSSFSDELLRIITPNMIINPNEYRISHYIAAGGLGVVYSAIHHYKNEKIAMKFFGYSTKSVNNHEIYHEIELFAAVNGTRGIVQLRGIFMDTPNGYVNNKFTKQCYPVICMELLEGGDLFDRIQARKTVSEKFVTRIFIEILLALKALHDIGYIHCDLKLENVMFTSDKEDTEVKLIDFGLMVKLPPNGIFYCQTIHGTAGYVAPESIKYCQYSPKSDIWQAGCILYSLLSGFQAFHPQYPELIVHGKYMKMSGIGWDNISSEAKDLVQQIFRVNPADRPSINQILEHKWLKGAAPDIDMGEQYYQRIKQRALRQRMKNLVFNRDIIAANNETKEKLKRIIPLLQPRQMQRRTRSSVIRGNSAIHQLDPSPTSAKCEVSSNFTSESSGKQNDYRAVVSLDDIDLICRERAKRRNSLEDLDPAICKKVIDDFNIKLTTLRTTLVQQTVGGVKNRIVEQRSISDASDDTPSPEIDLDTFLRVLHDCGLPELATPQMFHIFDPKNTGKMDLKEFLMTMVAFHDTANNMMDEPPQANDLFSSDDLNLQSNQFNQSSVVPGSLASYDSTGQRTEHVSIPHQRVGGDQERVNDPENDEHIRFYFNMFDFDNTGKIELDEMKIVIRCIFADLINQENRPTSSILTHQLSRHSSSHSIHSSPLRSPYYDLTSVPTLADIELMFENILQHSNINSKKSINYEEFKVFYNNLFINSSTIIHRS